jgi:hypothetical protein
MRLWMLGIGPQPRQMPAIRVNNNMVSILIPSFLPSILRPLPLLPCAPLVVHHPATKLCNICTAKYDPTDMKTCSK